MKNVFLDTNILLEIILNRKQKLSCQRILQAGIEGDIVLFASYLTFANMAYVLHKEKVPRQEIYAILRDLETILKVLPMDGRQLHTALIQEVTDFEDMLQYRCAKDGECESIVTINTSHFKSFSELPIYTPDQIIEILNKQ